MKTVKSSSPKTMLLILFLALLPSAAIYAENDVYVDSLWNASNTAYDEGRWEDALDGYELISSMGLESAALYCNMGDAAFKAENMPLAILNYERALKIDPSYSDAKYNLELLNGMIQDRIDPVPEFIISVWIKDVCRLMDSDSWAIAFLIFLMLTMAMFLLFILASEVAYRRTGFFTGIVLLILAISSISFSFWQKHDYMNEDSAIVMTPVSSVKSSPSSESSQNLFVLHEGTKVKIINTVGDWNNILLADGRQGWMPANNMEII